MAKQVKSTAVTMKNLVTERKRLLAIPKRERTSIEKVDLIKVDRQISEMNRAKIRRQKLGSNKPSVASQLDPQKPISIEPAPTTGPRGKLQTKKVIGMEELKGLGKPGEKETWEQVKERLSKKLKVDPRKKGPTATRADPNSELVKAAIKAKAKKAKEKEVSERKAEREKKAAQKKREAEEKREAEAKVAAGKRSEKAPKPKEKPAKTPPLSFGDMDLHKRLANISDEMDAQAAAEKKRLAELDRKNAAANKLKKVFDKDKDIFHKIAYGISQITGQDPTVTYDFPTEEEALGQKRGGKVTAKRSPTKKAAAKRPTTKKYAMNRGGMASVRKPTRA